MDPYERDQQRLLQLYNELPSDEDVHDPFSDTEGQYGSDEDYDRTKEASDSDDSDDMGHETPPSPLPLEDVIEAENDESDHETQPQELEDEWEEVV